MNTAWITLTIILVIIIITCIIIIILQQSTKPIAIPDNFQGVYGILLDRDANEIRRCGQSRDEPCLFSKQNVNSCIEECDILSDICKAFTFNPRNNTMKIVDPNKTYNSSLANLYIKN